MSDDLNKGKSSGFDQDDLVLQELKSQNIEGLTNRGRVAVSELAEMNHGAMIFLILSLNSRLRALEAGAPIGAASH